ncbi:MAG: lipocalin family protein [Lentisphaeria bacterium]|nr:lipocalin family protein [Lentisphaeria bacterium]MBQ7404743.1 lipocalin family protein [Lentisphaeria bacterium]
MNKWWYCLGMALFCFCGCERENGTGGIPAVTPFDLKRYMGTWYEIARNPHRFEKGLSHVSAVYTLNSDGTVSVLNRGIRENGTESVIRGIAKACPPSGSGELKVSFFRPFYGAYRVIWLSPDYRLAIVTSSTKDYLWVLCRDRRISAEEREFVLHWLREHGFSVSQLEWIEQDRGKLQSKSEG